MKKPINIKNVPEKMGMKVKNQNEESEDQKEKSQLVENGN
jgi:hypothetical protein